MKMTTVSNQQSSKDMYAELPKKCPALVASESTITDPASLVSSDSDNESVEALQQLSCFKPKNTSQAIPTSEKITASLVPTDLDDLVAMLHKELDGEGLDNMNVERVRAIMANYKSNQADWERFAMFDAGRYTRNLVDSGNGKFNLMILCWGAGQSSPIHDHSNSHCLVKVLDGNIAETQYDWPADSPHCANLPTSECGLAIKGQSTYSKDSVTYMHDKLGLHKVSNLSGAGAVSLHLYTPPFDTCKTFCEKTGVSRSSGKCVFYSCNGKKSAHIQDIKDSIAAKSGSTCGLSCASSTSRC